MHVTDTEKTLTSCDFNVCEIKTYMKLAFFPLRSMFLRSGHLQVKAGAFPFNLCGIFCPWTLDWVSVSPVLSELQVATLPVSSLLLLMSITGVLCDRNRPGE